MQPSLDQLIQICRTQVLDQEFVRVVLASIPSNLQDDTQLDVQFIEESDGPEFRADPAAARNKNYGVHLKKCRQVVQQMGSTSVS